MSTLGNNRLDSSDFDWTANPNHAYHSILSRLPQVFAWEDSARAFSSLLSLQDSVCSRRFDSCLSYVGLADSKLAGQMRQTFLDFPAISKQSFLTAPETFYRISILRRDPAKSIIYLCDSLNAEAASIGLDETVTKKLWTSLGDFYYAGQSRAQAVPSENHFVWNENRSFVAPRIASKIVIDFFSPSYDSAKNNGFPAEYLEYSADERRVVHERLSTAYETISKVSSVPAQLIRDFVKVLVPHKVQHGHGSTSQTSVPGRVLIRGAETSSLAWLISSLVHEAIHQLLYVLEFAGSFIVTDVERKSLVVRVNSLWTGRELAMHSFFHACFVWYGLANFWSRARNRSDLGISRSDVEAELNRAASGFNESNPVDALGTNSQLVRYDALCIARSLRDHLGGAASSKKVIAVS